MKKLDEFASGEVHETHERYIFNSTNQQSDKSIDALLWPALCKLVQTCNFCECLHDTLITDRIVLGVKIQKVKKKAASGKKANT